VPAARGNRWVARGVEWHTPTAYAALFFSGTVCFVVYKQRTGIRQQHTSLVIFHYAIRLGTRSSGLLSVVISLVPDVINIAQ